MRDTIPAREWEKVCDEFAARLDAATQDIEEPAPQTPIEFANWLGDQLQDDLDLKQYAVVESPHRNAVMLIMRRNGFSYPVTVGEPYR